MSRYYSVFRSDPSLVSRRSLWKTLVSVALALVSIGIVAYVLTNFVALQQSANDSAEQAGVARNALAIAGAARLGLIRVRPRGVRTRPTMIKLPRRDPAPCRDQGLRNP